MPFTMVFVPAILSNSEGVVEGIEAGDISSDIISILIGRPGALLDAVD